MKITVKDISETLPAVILHDSQLKMTCICFAKFWFNNGQLHLQEPR
jgi:hypothetical protein